MINKAAFIKILLQFKILVSNFSQNFKWIVYSCDDFQLPLLQSSASHDPSEIILIMLKYCSLFFINFENGFVSLFEEIMTRF